MRGSAVGAINSLNKYCQGKYGPITNYPKITLLLISQAGGDAVAIVPELACLRAKAIGR